MPIPSIAEASRAARLDMTIDFSDFGACASRAPARPRQGPRRHAGRAGGARPARRLDGPLPEPRRPVRPPSASQRLPPASQLRLPADLTPGKGAADGAKQAAEAIRELQAQPRRSARRSRRFRPTTQVHRAASCAGRARSLGRFTRLPPPPQAAGRGRPLQPRCGAAARNRSTPTTRAGELKELQLVKRFAAAAQGARPSASNRLARTRSA